MKQLADGTWIGGGGGISGPSNAIAYGSNGMSTLGQFVSGGGSSSAGSYGFGIGGSSGYPALPQPNPVKVRLEVPPGARSVHCEIEDGHVVATFLNENGEPVQRLIVDAA